jgi:TP901 family phage tail tape measure protein
MGVDIRLLVGADTTLLEKEIRKSLRGGYSLGRLNSKGFTQPLGRIKGQLGEFEKSLEASNARVIAFGASVAAIGAVSAALKGMVSSAIEVERSLTEINTILGVTGKRLSEFGNDLFSIANNTGQSFAVVAEAANELARQGLGVEETLKRANDALILTRISGMKAADSVSALTAVINGYNAAAYTSAEITNKLAAVDAAFAVSSADLAEALRRVGSTASTAGVGLEELLGIVAATQQVTARGGAVIGNAFKTIFTRMQRPRVITALESLGVATKDAEQNVLGMMDVLKNLAGTYDQLAPKQQSLVAELVGGVFQVNVLKAALGDLGKQYSLYASAVKIANNATNEAERRNKELNTTISSQLIVTLNNLKKAGAEVGSLTFGPAIKDTLGGVNTLLGGFKGGDKEAEGVGSKVAKGLLTGIGAVLKGPGIALLTLGIFKMFERLSKFGADAMGSVLGFNRQSKDTAVIQQQIMATMQKNPMIWRV